MQKTYANETFHIIKDCIYFYSENGYGNTKFNLNYFEKTLDVNATTRNYKTIVRLMTMASESD